MIPAARAAPPLDDRPVDEFDVGVVVVTYNSAQVIGQLLATLDGGLRGVTHRTVVVDNASADETVSMIRSAGLDVVVAPTNDGYAAAINRGVRLLPTARSILYLNADIELSDGCVAALFGALNDNVGVVAPKTYAATTPWRLDPSQRRTPTLLSSWAIALLGGRIADRLPGTSEVILDAARYEVPQDVDWVAGHTLLASRACVDAVGDWDESYFLYSEETDFCERVRLAGYVVRYLPTAVVVHPGGDGDVNPRLRAMMAVNRVRFFRRRHGTWASWVFWLSAVVHEATRALGGGAASRRAALALLSPRWRPPEINASESRLPQ